MPFKTELTMFDEPIDADSSESKEHNVANCWQKAHLQHLEKDEPKNAWVLLYNNSFLVMSDH